MKAKEEKESEKDQETARRDAALQVTYPPPLVFAHFIQTHILVSVCCLVLQANEERAKVARAKVSTEHKLNASWH